MVYKLKNTKRARRLAEIRQKKKLATAAAAYPNDSVRQDVRDAATPSMDGTSLVGRVNTTTEMPAAATLADPPCSEATTPPTYRPAQNSLEEGRPSQSEELPHVLAATPVPAGSGAFPQGKGSAAAAVHREMVEKPSHVAYLMLWHLDGSVPVFLWGVYAMGTGNCAQVLYWPPGSVPRGEPAARREVVMHVNAAGQCFVLAPSALVSAEGARGETQLTPTSASQDGHQAAATPSTDCVYWLIPSLLQENFFALLWAQAWLRTLPGALWDEVAHSTGVVVPNSAPSRGDPAQTKWGVQRHPTRWASAIAMASASTQQKGEHEVPAVMIRSTAHRQTKQMKRLRAAVVAHPSPLQPLQPQPSRGAQAGLSPDPSSTGNVGGATTSKTSPCRLPYVVAVVPPSPPLQPLEKQNMQGCSILPSAPPVPTPPAPPISTALSQTWLFVMGNSVAAYPSELTGVDPTRDMHE